MAVIMVQKRNPNMHAILNVPFDWLLPLLRCLCVVNMEIKMKKLYTIIDATTESWEN